MQNPDPKVEPETPQPTPATPYPEPARPPTPPETPQPDLPPELPSPLPEQVPGPGTEPIGVPPTSPPEIPVTPSTAHYRRPTRVLRGYLGLPCLRVIGPGHSELERGSSRGEKCFIDAVRNVLSTGTARLPWRVLVSRASTMLSITREHKGAAIQTESGLGDAERALRCSTNVKGWLTS